MEIPSASGADMQGMVERRIGEISALHLSARTARMLDLWAGALAHEAPLFVAVNAKGWLVATPPIAKHLSLLCPSDLAVALRLGRCRGLAYLLFHSDAPVIAELPRYAW